MHLGAHCMQILQIISFNGIYMSICLLWRIYSYVLLLFAWLTKRGVHRCLIILYLLEVLQKMKKIMIGNRMDSLTFFPSKYLCYSIKVKTLKIPCTTHYHIQICARHRHIIPRYTFYQFCKLIRVDYIGIFKLYGERPLVNIEY